MDQKVKSKNEPTAEGVYVQPSKMKGEHVGHYGRRCSSIKANVERFERARIKALEQVKEVSPKSFGKRLLEKFIVEPFNAVVEVINDAIDYLLIPVSEDGSVEYFFISEEDKKNGTNKYMKITDNSGVIILFAKLVMQKKFIATIKWKGSKADKAKHGMDMLALQGDPTFVTVPPLTITATRILVTNYGNSSPGTEEATFNLMNNAFIAIMFLYQTYANANAGTAEDAIKSGGFLVKTITPRGKQPWTAVNSVVQGTIDLTANGVEIAGGFHEWLISFDGITFERMLPTTHAHTQVTGLAGGIEVWFMHQEIDKRGPQGFDLVIRMTVNR